MVKICRQTSYSFSKPTYTKEASVVSYEGEYKIEDTGYYSYGIRVFPYSEKLLTRQDAELCIGGRRKAIINFKLKAI